MTTELLDQAQLRQRGFEVLVRSLGWTDAVRFVQQYDSSRLNYTAEREQMLSSADAQELMRELEYLTKRAASASAKP